MDRAFDQRQLECILRRRAGAGQYGRGRGLGTLGQLRLGSFDPPRFVRETAKGKAPLGSECRLEMLEEGLCVQIMYIGAYDDEPPVIARMHAYIHEQGYVPRGKHHEIYLSDVRKVAPEKNRTILRQPVSMIGGQNRIFRVHGDSNNSRGQKLNDRERFH